MDRFTSEDLEGTRAALRERGYLHSRLDRLLLEGAGSRAGWLRGALKAGFLSGIFLGLSLLAALLLTNEPALTAPAEILVLGFYLLLMASLIMGAVEVFLGFVARRLSGLLPPARSDTDRIARWAGGIAALACGFYLSLWWRGRGVQGWNLVAHLAVLPAILTLSLAFGRITSVAALLSLIRPGRIPIRRERRKADALALAILLLLVGAVFAIPWERSQRQERASAPARFEIRPREGRVLWIGIDGLGTVLFRALSEKGRLSELSRLARESCWIDLTSPSAEPPAIWVSAATGFPPDEHGVQSIQASTLPGMATPLGNPSWFTPLITTARWLEPEFNPIRRVPVSASFRREKTVWEILADRGLPSTVVNWWATWPADPGPGLRISERAFFKLESGGKFDREVFPPAEFQKLAEEFPRLLEAFRRNGGDPGSPEELPLLLDAFHLGQAGKSWRLRHWPLTAAYLNGSDVVSERARTGPSAADRIRETERLLEHLGALDAELGAMIARAGPEDFVVIQGDPGRDADRRREQGFLILRGKGVEGGLKTRGDLLDVAPTVLLLLGFPRSLEMSGHPPSPCLDPSGELARGIPRIVRSYGDRRRDGAKESDFDPEMLQRLRSLGYIR